MDFDQLLMRFFGTVDLEGLSADALVAGTTRLRLQFGMEKDEERRFGLWCLMYMLGTAPEVDQAFVSEEDRDAAQEFADSVDADIEEAE
ncbi:hypothetical protein [Sphingomonas solaris]|uniref:Uncharacterized protein n=1 Tax=Alterirhizorhabdus solaris TaxID=2529389 RepID=A0A558QSU4_9SPHN|nr:hypothetical protein [Sphingomonas solaris]TVV70184.1 hypothetical protein FOY91_19685 [Sphingomonas solaris]